jgi:hypothetical protein
VLPRHRPAGLALALTLHVFCLLALIPSAPTPPTSDAERTAADKAVTPVERPQPAPTPTSSGRDEEIDKYLPRPASLRVWGFDFDVRKIRTRWNARDDGRAE